MTLMCGQNANAWRNCVTWHRNPVERGLVESPEQWRWSSFCSYLYGEKGLVRVNYQELPSRIAPRPAQKFGNSAA
jgi:hypothetical protein